MLFNNVNILNIVNSIYPFVPTVILIMSSYIQSYKFYSMLYFNYKVIRHLVIIYSCVFADKAIDHS